MLQERTAGSNRQLWWHLWYDLMEGLPLGSTANTSKSRATILTCMIVPPHPTPSYQGVPEALAACPYPYYIATSKAARRLVPLLRHSRLGLDDIDESSPRIFAALLPPNERKIETLRCVGGGAGGDGRRGTLGWLGAPALHGLAAHTGLLIRYV